MDINVHMGASVMRQYIKGLGLDGSWLSQKPQQTLLTGGHQARGLLSTLADAVLYSDYFKEMQFCALSHARLGGCLLATGRPLVPFRLQLETEHLDLRASGWRTTTGFVLRRPASATVTFTPALAK